MARVKCEIEETELENDDGRSIPGVTATCNRCGNETESYGTSEASILRCLAMMRDDCPLGQHNFYVEDEDDGSFDDES